ncbi:alpha/beta hydrolase [Variovorax paradoxus]|nr:alpha/beta hydrolase [Variovorax paradoxus]
MTIGYTLIGNGPTKVVAAHTWLCDHQTYAPMIPFLDADRFTFAFPDFRGYGKSKHIGGEFSVREMGRDLLGVADQLNWREFHLVGNSMGGQSAQWLASQGEARDRVRSLTLLCAVPASGFPLDAQGAAFFGAAASDVDVRGQCASAVTGGRLGTGFAKHMANLSAATATPEAIEQYLRAWTEEDVSAESGNYAGPVHVHVGEHDPVLTAAVMQAKVLPLFPQCAISTVAGAGHYPAMEVPAYVAELLTRGLEVT